MRRGRGEVKEVVGMRKHKGNDRIYLLTNLFMSCHPTNFVFLFPPLKSLPQLRSLVANCNNRFTLRYPQLLYLHFYRNQLIIYSLISS